MLIKLKKDILAKCKEFSEVCAETNKYYASRGQANLEKIKSDIFVGKLGEWASYELLKSKGYEVSAPDMEITRKKSHDADLSTHLIKFSVKTQSLGSVRKYGMSWLMEKNSLKKFKDHYVILCMQISDQEILVQNIVKFSDMLAVQGEPKLAYLTSKAAFYYEDIICDKLKEVVQSYETKQRDSGVKVNN